MKHKSENVELHMGSYVTRLKLNSGGGVITSREKEMILGVVNSLSGDFYEADLERYYLENELFIEINTFESDGYQTVRILKREFSTNKNFQTHLLPENHPAEELKHLFRNVLSEKFIVRDESV
mgnify:CR=1 FL=1|jgi:hypothetical protein